FAKLKDEHAKAVAIAARPADPADEKLASSVKSYTQFKQDLAAFFADMEKLRKENSVLGEQLKEASAKSEKARASLAQVEDELKKEKASRVDAEQAAANLRDQLRAIARAVASAGLNVEKLA